MKILHVISNLNRGMTQKQLRLLAIELHKRKFSQHVVCLSSPGFNSGMLEEYGIPVLHLNINHPVQSYKMWTSIVGKLGDFDIVNGWMYYGCFAAKYFQKKHFQNSKLVFNLRDSIENINSSRRFKMRIIQKVAEYSQRADRIIYGTEEIQHEHESLGYRIDGVVIPSGFDVMEYDKERRHRKTLRRRYRFDRFRKTFICVGDFDESADFPNLLQAIQMILEKHRDLLFVFVGTGMTNRNRILKATVSEDAMENIWLLGDRGDVRQMLMAADFFIYAARYEAPLSVVGEAMSAGLPCIVTDAGDAEKLLGASGEIIPPNSSMLLAKAVENFQQLDDEEYQNHSFVTLDRIRTFFSIDVITDHYEHQFHHLMEEEKDLEKTLT